MKDEFFKNYLGLNLIFFSVFSSVISGTPETKSLWGELTQQEIIYNANKNRPEYLAWEKLNREDPAEINNFKKQYPASSYAKKINILTERHEKIYAQKAITSKSLSDIENYNKLFPDGKNKSTISKIENDLKKDAKYNEVKKLIEEGNKYKLTEFIKKNKATPLKNTVASSIQKKSDIYYRLEITDTSIIIQLINFDKPSVKVIDPANELIINSSQLKSKGFVEVSYENDASSAYLLITDSNGRERKIKLDRSIQATLAKMDDKIIELIIEGGIPPYILEFYNTDALYVEKNYEGIKTDKENKYIIGKDSLRDLGGNYDLHIKNLDGQDFVLAGLYFESSSNRMIYFGLLTVGVIALISVVVKLYLRRSRQKTIFDEYE